MSVEDVRTKYNAVAGADAVTSGPLTFAISVEGLDATGKSRFGLLTCPRPIVHINYGDRDVRSILYDASPERRKDITLYEQHAQSPDGWTRAEAKESLDALAEIARGHLSDRGLAGGTFIIDSGSTWWDSLQEVYVAPEMEKRDASGGKRRGGLEYTKANMILSGVLNWIKNQGAFLVITHTKAQEWDAQGPVPGKYRARLNNRVPYIVEIRLDLTKECMECGAPDCKAHVGRKHFGQLIKFGRNTALEGMKFEDKAITFDMIYKLYTGDAFPNEGALE